ncbi:MAG: lipid-A-disaccharide synthase N-terminal domain-containing protein [Bacteroidota bacterium]
MIGIIGLVSIVACWIPQTIETIKTKRCNIKLSFLVLYLVGSVSLTVHAYFIGDLVFMILNSIATGEAAVNLYYKVHSP